MTLVFALAFLQLPPIEPFATELRSAVTSGNRPRVEALFQSVNDSGYLFRMATDRGGLRNLKVAVIPSPPGWEATGNYWAIIHTRQDIEQHHDPVYPVVVDGVRWKLGPEIPEDATAGIAIKNAVLDVHLLPDKNSVQVHTTLGLTIAGLRRAPLFRLNDNYHVQSAMTATGAPNVVEVADEIPKPKTGDLVHAGSLLVPWDTTIPSQYSFNYNARLDSANEDKIDARVCYLTAWWVPTLGRLPFATATRIVGPADWVLQSEGPPTMVFAGISNWPDPIPAAANEQVKYFQCEVPISYPKVIGGKYILAASKTVGGRTFRAYHLNATDKARAEKDVQTMADSIAWYDEHLGKFPFNEYNCYDADTYYGIESYNYTLLQTRITSWAVSHEAGHTYFGGLVPCAYVHDSWNESMTQYVDSVLRLNNSDRTLDNAYGSLRIHVPLTEMPVTDEYGSATYYRGAFVLRMLENQIGTDKMYQGIRALIADRRGKDTTWYDLRPYFEKAWGKKLDWFWNQWISSADFPTLTITDAQGITAGNGTIVKVTVRQSGTRLPYRLRFKVIARGINDEVSQVFEMSHSEETFDLNLGKVKAYEASIDTFGYVFCPKLQAVKVKL